VESSGDTPPQMHRAVPVACQHQLSLARRPQMIQMIRYCPDCASDQPFEPFHLESADCPGITDGTCPEWACAACGAAFLIDFVSYVYESAAAPGIRDRVA
jgi:hypothetical protein